jgi:hypothetical protein
MGIGAAVSYYALETDIIWRRGIYSDDNIPRISIAYTHIVLEITDQLINHEIMSRTTREAAISISSL